MMNADFPALTRANLTKTVKNMKAAKIDAPSLDDLLNMSEFEVDSVRNRLRSKLASAKGNEIEFTQDAWNKLESRLAALDLQAPFVLISIVSKAYEDTGLPFDMIIDLMARGIPAEKITEEMVKFLFLLHRTNGTVVCHDGFTLDLELDDRPADVLVVALPPHEALVFHVVSTSLGFCDDHMNLAQLLSRFVLHDGLCW